MIDRRLIARRFLRMIPYLMRKVNSDLRCMRDGMDPSHFRLLMMLGHGPCTISELASRQSVSLATMSNTTSILAERGWVLRSPVSHDRRMVQVELTPLGRVVLEEIYERMESRIAALLEQLEEDQLVQLGAGIDLLSQILGSSSDFELAGCQEETERGRQD